MTQTPVQPESLTTPWHWSLPTLVDVAQWRAAETPHQAAYTFLLDGETETATLSYAELDRRARQIAVELQDRGLSGSRVLIALDPGLDYIATLFGCFYAGAVAAPVYPPDPYRIARMMPRLKAIFDSADCGLLVSSRELLGGSTSSLRQVSPNAALAIEDINSAANTTNWQPPASDGKRLAVLQYTSGTTSTPRGVAISFDNLHHNMRAMEQVADVDDALMVHWLPPYHDMGLVGGILLPLFAGREVKLLSPFHFMQHPARWLQAISRYGATTTASPNFGYDLCVQKVRDEDCEGLDLSNWQVAVSGAEKVRAETIDRFCNKFAPYGFRREAFVPAYGMAETTLMVSISRPDSEPLARVYDTGDLANRIVTPVDHANGTTTVLVGSGPPGPEIEVRIVDPATNQPTDGIGEIWVRSPGVARGYWRNAKATRGAFDVALPCGTSGFLRTGDMGFLDAGELFVTGRMKEVLILAGRNFYPQDIELAIQAKHPALKPSAGAVVSIEVEQEERLIAFQEVLRPRKQNFAELAMLMREAVTEETLSQPHAVVLIATGELPKTSSGKTQRGECLRAYQAGELTVLYEWRTDSENDGKNDGETDRAEPVEFVPPQDETETWLASVWATVLHVDEISRHDHFFDLGGRSLQVGQMLSLVAERTGIVLPLGTLFAHPTLAQLAEQLTEPLGNEPATEIKPLVHADKNQTTLPLSPSQQRFWLLDQFGLAGGTNVPLAMRITGRLDRERLQTSLDGLVDRHEALRTELVGHDADVKQQVVEKATLTLQELSPPAELPSDPIAWALDQPWVWQSFETHNAPLARAATVSLGEDDHLLVLVLHHLIGDGASLATLVHDLTALYRGETLPPVEWTYRDYLANLPTGENETDLRYWQQRLAESPAAIELPFDRPQTPATLSDIQTTAAKLDATLAAAIERQATALGVTPFMLYLAAWQLVLSRYTPDTQIATGVAIAGRHRSAWSKTVGCFINTLPLLTDVSTKRLVNQTAGEFLTELRNKTLADMDHASLPWEQMVEAAAKPRLAGRMPLVQTFFLFDDQGPIGESNLGNCQVAAAATDYRGLGLYDATLAVSTASKTPQAELIHDRRLINDSVAERLLASYQAVLESLANQTDETLASLPVPAESEREQLLAVAAGRQVAEIVSPLEKFAQQVKQTPAAVAIECGDRQMTYAELDDAANQLAARLRAKGVSLDDRVGLMISRSVDTIPAMLAIWKVGAAYVPLDPAYPAERIERMAADAELAFTLTDESLPTLLADDSPLHDFEPTPGRLAYVIYTSGSTGKPKGVMVPHDAVGNLLDSLAREIKFGPTNRLLAATTISFDISVLELFLPLATGGRVVLADSAAVGDPAKLTRLIESAKVDFIQGTPSTFRMLIGTGWRPTSDQKVLCGGEAMTTDVARQLLDATPHVWNVYGPTETTVWSTTHQVTDPKDAAIIGRPIDNTTCYILDSQKNLAPQGMWGELAIGGVGVTDGYWKQPELTTERFPLDPFTASSENNSRTLTRSDERQANETKRIYLTGDVARLRPDGTLEFRGRDDGQVKVRGHRIELGEIEAALTAIDTINEAAVVVHRDEQGMAALVAYVATATQIDPAALRSTLAVTLPDFMLPSAFITLPALPRTDNGKLNRNALAKRDELPIARSATLVAPRTPVEMRLAEWWQELLRLDAVGVEDSLFEIGGHSLMAMQLVVRIRDEMGVELPLREVYQQPTIAAWAQMIVASQIDDSDAELLEQLENMSDEEAVKFLEGM